MAKRVTFIKDCTVRTILGDNGRVPRSITEYKAGQSVLIPEHHYEQVLKQEAVADGDAGAGTASGEAEKNTRRTKKGDAPGA